MGRADSRGSHGLWDSCSDVQVPEHPLRIPGTALGDAPLPEASGQTAKNQAFVSAPERGHKKRLWPVSGEPVDDHFRRQQGNAVNDRSTYSSMENTGNGCCA